MVVCEQDYENEYYKKALIILIEVLSKTTRRFDQMTKRLRCQQLSSLEYYALIEQDTQKLKYSASGIIGKRFITTWVMNYLYYIKHNGVG